MRKFLNVLAAVIFWFMILFERIFFCWAAGIELSNMHDVVSNQAHKNRLLVRFMGIVLFLALFVAIKLVFKLIF